MKHATIVTLNNSALMLNASSKRGSSQCLQSAMKVPLAP
jgi:hypothetical protein